MKTFVLGLVIVGMFTLAIIKINSLAEDCVAAGPADCQVAP